MYNVFFGLKKDAFRMTPDPSTICLTVKHREALAGLSYAILRHKGFTVLTGDAGTGKTTLISRVVQTLPRDKVTVSLILNSVLTPSEFLEAALLDFGLRDIPVSKAQRLEQMRTFLLGEYNQGKICVLIVDEAQDLTAEVLEEVRLLSNCELPDRKLIQIVLSGQSELEDLLNRQALRQLKQRVEVHLRITPLTAAELREYIRFRWVVAGGTMPPPFDESAIASITEYSSGVPRLINTICDNCLLAAFSEATRTVTAKHVEEVALDLGLKAGRQIIAPTAAVRGEDGRSGAVTAQPPAPVHSTNGDAEKPITLPSLARYDRTTSQPSRLSRWAARLGLAS
ncbi:MAG TPA: AAA family ATPase [Bryobacteraceae bacterium]|nr:AAA family ATPase [Bryobacteraceae bacterium]